jgi:hypothetical protein
VVRYEATKLLKTTASDLFSAFSWYSKTVSSCAHCLDKLPQNSAVVGIVGGHYHSSLQAAASTGQMEIVRLLRLWSADDTLTGSGYEGALPAAYVKGWRNIVPNLCLDETSVRNFSQVSITTRNLIFVLVVSFRGFPSVVIRHFLFCCDYFLYQSHGS